MHGSSACLLLLQLEVYMWHTDFLAGACAGPCSHAVLCILGGIRLAVTYYNASREPAEMGHVNKEVTKIIRQWKQKDDWEKDHPSCAPPTAARHILEKKTRVSTCL